MAQKLQNQLREVGSKLESPPTSKDALIKLLKQAASCLSELDQSPLLPMLESMQPCLNAIVNPELLKHQDRDVKLLVATCICEITRITAPEAPYSDDVLRDIFNLIVGTFGGLRDINGPSFGRRVVILETLARYRSCVVMLDLECDDLVNEMFSTFFSVASDDHPESVLTSMEKIMVLLIEESEDVQDNLLLVLLSVLGREKSDVSMAARRLAMNVIEHCAGKLEPGIKQFLISSMSGDKNSLSSQLDYHDVVYDLYHCAPQILSGIIPYLTGELLTDQADTRLKAVRLLGDLFALRGSVITEAFQPLFSEFLKRLTDRVAEVRISVIGHVKSCLLSDPFRPEAPQIIAALADRLLDYDENVRKQVVAAVCDVACHTLKSIPVEITRLVAERLRDKSILVKKYTMERLAEIYRLYCLNCSDGSSNSNEYDWIPGKIMKCFFDKDFRSETIEVVLCRSLFPAEFSINNKVRHWVRIFSGFDKVEVKALERILDQKQRLQQEMQKYLSLRQTCQDADTTEFQKKSFICFRIMSRWFSDPAKAEESFQILDQLKDANIWKILTTLLDPSTSFQQAWMSRDDLLRILGEKHRLYDFLSALSVKCPHLLFNKEHVKEILLEASRQNSADNAQYILSCMNLLVILARFSPSLLSGTEEDLVHLLKDDNEVIKEGVLHVLARAGGIIREQLAATSSSVDLILERLCLEGNRKQAKYAVHALAAITKDDGLMSLSVLYKRLVDLLDEKTHLPAVLQSLGCIAQTAMPVFETREGEIVEFITSKILKCGDKADDNTRACWEDRSELCSLKIFGLKTLVKRYLPVKEAHLLPGIENLVGILRNILSFGEISKDIVSSPVDKAHMKLASAKAVLRLSKNWDHKIPIDVFHLTLRTSEDTYPQVKKLFLGKVHQYIKDRLLDAKYACAFVCNIVGSQPPEFKEDKQNLVEIVQMCQQAKVRQLFMHCDANPLMVYPEYILPFLVHALAHHSSCPDIDDCKDVEAYEPIYRQLYLFLSLLLHGDEDTKSGVSTGKDECVATIISIFQSIKFSQDIVDLMKTKHSHAICDLGLSIAKRLVQKKDEMMGSITSVPLPPSLYKPQETKDGVESLVNEGKTWLANDDVVAHFESLKLETNGLVHSEVLGDEKALKVSDRDENEMPLGKMMKRLISQRTKARKVVKNKALQAARKNKETDIDILGMVREINVESLENSKYLESRNGHGCFLGEEIEDDQSMEEKVPVSRKRKRRKLNDTTSLAVPKRRRSSSRGFQKSSQRRSTSKSLGKASTENSHWTEISSLQPTEMDVDTDSDSKDKVTLEKEMVEPSGSDLLASCLPTKKSSSSIRKGTGRHLDDVSHMYGKANEHELKPDALVKTDKNNFIGNAKSSAGNIKKRKRRSIAGLAKCSLKGTDDHITDLIGCRIKVWWPLDKQFYEGVVQSYDRKKRKHEILYDDGDLEVLNLEKERWELIRDAHKPRELKSSKISPAKGVSKGVSPQQKQNKSTPGGPRWNKKSNKKQKRTAKKTIGHRQNHMSESKGDDDTEVESGIASHSSSPKYAIAVKQNGVDAGKWLDKTERSPVEESCEEKSVSKDDVGMCTTGVEDSDEEEKPESEGDQVQDTAKNTSIALGSNKEEETDSEERVEEAEGSPSNGDESNKEGQSDYEGSAPNKDEKSDPSESRDTGDSDNSDNEPLSTWKHWGRKGV
ncbi:sister chromatid cohesion protein PDS5 homolog A-B isoform X2 [Macadamia integrifolia]|uniref:sister chromatid cohesion protein PDS5 homolog A-B isoform X2 n=1 Tax=Macadamia integrifolia TaxID=60698 RepID=UPI001C5332FA|nr:sister chromatid cohesion protein PDS5 homolog A-B isoform X2 [Macadamia integrifolia]